MESGRTAILRSHVEAHDLVRVLRAEASNLIGGADSAAKSAKYFLGSPIQISGMQHNTIDVLYSKSAHALVFVSPTGFRLLPLNDYDVPQTDHMSEFVPFEAGVSAHRAVIHPAVRFHYVLTMKRVDPVHSVQWQ